MHPNRSRPALIAATVLCVAGAVGIAAQRPGERAKTGILEQLEELTARVARLESLQARVHIGNVRVSGTNFGPDAYHSGWGETCYWTVKFEPPFEVPPKVFVALSLVDGKPGGSVRSIAVFLEEVRRDGMTVGFQAMDADVAAIRRVDATWILIPQPEDLTLRSREIGKFWETSAREYWRGDVLIQSGAPTTIVPGNLWRGPSATNQ